MYCNINFINSASKTVSFELSVQTGTFISFHTACDNYIIVFYMISCWVQNSPIFDTQLWISLFLYKNLRKSSQINLKCKCFDEKLKTFQTCVFELWRSFSQSVATNCQCLLWFCSAVSHGGRHQGIVQSSFYVSSTACVLDVIWSTGKNHW